VTGTLLAIETVVLALLTVLVAGLLRSHAEILSRLHALGAGIDPDAPASLRPPRPPLSTPHRAGAASDVEGVGLRDDAMSVAVVGTGHQTLLAFLTSGCLTCRGFWEAFGDPRASDFPCDLGDINDISDIRFVVVAKDAHEESASALRRLAPSHLTVVMSSAAWEAYRVPGAPYFVLVDGPDGVVRGEGTGTSWPQVWNLLRQASDDSREQLIDRELLSHGVAPGDPTLYRPAGQLAQTAQIANRRE
jgi:hypothetical protein